MSNLLELAERCEKATGPDRQIDGFIYRAVNGVPDWKRGPNMLGHIEGVNGAIIDSPAFTASIDAAMKLVPEDYDWIIARTNGGLTIHACCGNNKEIFGETPALALCAAALRARAAVASERQP